MEQIALANFIILGVGAALLFYTIIRWLITRNKKKQSSSKTITATLFALGVVLTTAGWIYYKLYS
ncbi:MAG TPA: hypothetical protein VFT87_04500 [Candidatus Saccharimonadales bacterium]|nr:hypothetical protein [Candidatus Saccharimonadales bacterium]